MAKRGLFVGMVTWDLIYLTDGPPSSNQKIAASDYAMAAGGPATNAAVTFSYLKNQSTIVGVLGNHPLSHLIKADLETYNVAIADLNSTQSQPPPLASIIITQATGDRAVVSLPAPKTDFSSDRLTADLISNIDVVLIDGHQMVAGRAIASLAKARNIPVVIDGGSWKPGFETVLPFVDYALCSANFYPPGCGNAEEAITYLQAIGIPHIAITNGEKPIQYVNTGETAQLVVPQINAVDTVAAGDIFHGAFCHYILWQSFPHALASAAKIASHSCQFFGTRRWMEVEGEESPEI
ncbi:MAG: sugar kinase [Kastovskya adunca ATA6-11-RM4]|jgi:sugar/nucleoside kinase (ribokinase family)|nr:sugar kinase [Kastovskya adunca ATA6-11-RM4]